MKRIGVTNEGGALIELSAEEVATIQAALAVLGEIGGDVPQSIPPPALSARAVRPPKSPKEKPAKVAAAPATEKTCSICGKTKPAAGFYKVGRQCKVCLIAKARANYQPKTKRAQVAKAKATPPPVPASDDTKPPRRPFGPGIGPKPLVMNPDARAKRLAAIKEADRRIAERDPHLDPPQEHGRTLPVGGQE